MENRNTEIKTHKVRDGILSVFLNLVMIVFSLTCIFPLVSFALVLIKYVALQTVPLALTQFKGQFASDYPKQMAAMLITRSPIVILYFVFSKEIIKGMVPVR